jgi:hypothetical protein
VNLTFDQFITGRIAYHYEVDTPGSGTQINGQ